MKARYLLLILCAFPVLGTAQNTAVGGPVSGFVFDQKAQSVRPMLGVPGAAYLGDAALSGVDAAGVAQDGNAALVSMEGRLYLVTGLKSDTTTTASIDGAIDGIDRIAWAAGGDSAAVYASRSGRAQLLRKLSGTPEAGDALDLSALPGSLTALASAGDGILAAVAEEADGGVYFVKAGAAPRLLASAVKPAGLAVSGADLYFADQGTGQVWQIAGFAGDATRLLFAEGLQSPVGVQVAGKRLFVANAGDNTLEIFDMTARASAGRLALDVAPTTLESFGGRALWLLNGAGAAGDPLYVLDGGDNPAVYFVPAGREE